MASEAINPLSARRPWRIWRSPVLRGLAVAAVALGGLEVLSSQDRLPPFRDSLRAFNRRWANPLVLRFAGGSTWSVARLEHRGRRGRDLYVTPLLAWPVSGGFLMPMPYGPDVDWARNLRHADDGVLQHQGVRYRIGNPRIESAASALPDLPFPIDRLVAMSGIRHVMRVDVRDSLTAEVSPPA